MGGFGYAPPNAGHTAVHEVLNFSAGNDVETSISVLHMHNSKMMMWTCETATWRSVWESSLRATALGPNCNIPYTTNIVLYRVCCMMFVSGNLAPGMTALPFKMQLAV
jgi:hypothetical protein